MRKKKYKKLPNGFGSIKHLSGNRTNPYAAYPSVTAFHPNGSPVTQPAIGYFKDWYEAYDALAAYNRNVSLHPENGMTFSEVYEKLYQAKFVNNCKQLSESSRSAYETAFKNCEPLHDMKFGEIRKQDMQTVIDNCRLGYSSLSNMKILFGQIYQFAMENDIVEKNYAQFVTINRENDNEKGEPFSPEELEILWENSQDAVVQMILMMIYSGFRIKAYETIEINIQERIFRGGVKTSAGKDRIVPIHPAIFTFAHHFYEHFPNFNARSFRAYRFYPKLERLGILTTTDGKKHTPHDCRHTFSWLCDKYKVDDLSKHLLMGHSLGSDVEKSVYGHRTVEELREEIEKIQI
jgi:integrase